MRLREEIALDCGLVHEDFALLHYAKRILDVFGKYTWAGFGY